MFQNALSENTAVKKEMTDLSDKASVCESVSETPDSPSPTRHYERTSPIEIPTERSDDRDYKPKNEKNSHRYDDNRYRHDNQHSDRSSHSRYEDRHLSRYEQHEHSKSRDLYKHDRRSNSSERSRHRNDRNRNESDRNDRYRNESEKHRYSHDSEKYDPFEHRKKYDDRTDRTSCRSFKTENKYERSGRYSPSSHRDIKKLGKHPESESYNSAFNRLGARASPVVPITSEDRKLTKEDVAEITKRNSMLYGCDDSDEEIAAIKNLTEVRSKLAKQIAESTKNKDNKPSAVNDSSLSGLSKISLNTKKTGSKFELNLLRQPTASNYPVKEDSNQFSFLKTFDQASRSLEVPTTSKDAIKVDEDIIKKIVNQPKNEASFNKVTPVIAPVIPNLDMVKKALTTVKQNEERLALKYNPKARTRIDQSITQASPQSPKSEVIQPNNLQLTCINDPRLSRVRDPRVHVQQDLRMQPFSPPSTPPCIPNYPPIIHSSSGYKQTSYSKPSLLPTPNHYHHAQQSSYQRAMSPQHHLQSHPNVIQIPTHVSTYNNQRGHHQASPVSSTDVSPTTRYQYQQPPFPEPNRNSSGIHTNFRPSLNDNVERQKYEQSRNIRRSSYYENNDTSRNDTPRTYGEYRRLQSTVSSTSEKVNNETVTRGPTNEISTSYLDNVYRTGNYSTPIPLVAPAMGSKFKIPKKTSNDTAKPNEIPTEICESKQDSEDEQLNVRGVKDSDDSEHEISGKGTVNSDSEASDCRDPRIRVQALKKASQSNENKTKDSAEKQNNVVTSSTSILPDSLTSKDGMETILKQLMKPENLLAFINLSGLAGDDTLTQVKEVLESRLKKTSTPVRNEESNEKQATSSEREKIDTPKTPKKKKLNELDKLNEDIRTMFISDGVLNATGRRVCALYNNADHKEPTAPKRKPKLQSKDDVGIEKQQKQSE